MRKHVRYNNIEVTYEENLNGGGMRFGQQYIPVIKEKFGKVDHIFEFCSGPGFIGFSLLANNLCDKLTLADINPEAIRACNETIKNNNLESKVSAYVSDCLDNIPETEKWDLVVSNPPHTFCSSEDEYKKNIILYDPHFRIHRKFYNNIRKFLKPTGSVLFQEHTESTNVSDFKEMIETNGLKIVDVFVHTPPFEPKSGQKSIGFNRSTFQKMASPFRVYKAVKRRLWPTKPRSYYFIWCKLT